MKINTFVITRLLTVVLSMAGLTMAQAKLNVVATTPDLGALAQAVGGDHITLTVLAKPTEDPHFVDAKPSYIAKVNRADVLIEGGAELEMGWLPPLVDGARNNKIQSGQPGRILASEGIRLTEVPATLDRSKGDIHAAGNPHFLSSPANGRIVAEHICKVLCQLDPDSATYFKASLNQFTEKLEAKRTQWKAALAPFHGKDVISYHNSWPYFAEEFGLKMELFLEPKPGIPPTPAHLAGVITAIKDRKAKAIVVQAFQNRKTAEIVAARTDANVIDFPLFPNNGQSYIDWIDSLVKSLADTFNK